MLCFCVRACACEECACSSENGVDFLILDSIDLCLITCIRKHTQNFKHLAMSLASFEKSVLKIKVKDNRYLVFSLTVCFYCVSSPVCFQSTFSPFLLLFFPAYSLTFCICVHVCMSF